MYNFNGTSWDFNLNTIGPKGDTGYATTWRDGSGAPVALALDKDGDYYLDIVTGAVYKYNLGTTTWGLIGSIKGATGAGSIWTSGASPPIPGVFPPSPTTQG